MPFLFGDLLDARRRFLSTTQLDKVHDVAHAFFACATCGNGAVSISVITANVHGVMNELPALAKLLADTPERMIPDARTTTCKCGTVMRLASAVFCRTNPRQGNDFHLRVRYPETDDVPEDMFEAAILFPDGRYGPLPQEQLIRLMFPALPR